MPRPEEPIHQVLRLVATSPTSWEDAARSGVREAASSIDDLRNARVTELDLTRVDDEVRYRVKLEVSYRIDRARRSVEDPGRTVQVHRILLVANQTLDTDAVTSLVTARAAGGPCELHVVVPRHQELRTDDTLSMSSLHPMGGYTPVMVEDEEASEHATRDRLRSCERLLDDLGVAHTAEIGPRDPYVAVTAALERTSVDEIVISMLPGGASRWLRLDLPSRLRRLVDVPVTTIQPES
ncbi:MAG: dodecin family protein [Actinomycetota bacterium]